MTDDEDYVSPFDCPKKRKDDNTGEPISPNVVPETSKNGQLKHVQSAYQSVYMDVDYHDTTKGAPAYILADAKVVPCLSNGISIIDIIYARASRTTFC